MTKGVVGQEQVAKVNFRKLIIRLGINHPDKKNSWWPDFILMFFAGLLK